MPSTSAIPAGLRRPPIRSQIVPRTIGCLELQLLPIGQGLELTAAALSRAPDSGGVYPVRSEGVDQVPPVFA